MPGRSVQNLLGHGKEPPKSPLSVFDPSWPRAGICRPLMSFSRGFTNTAFGGNLGKGSTMVRNKFKKGPASPPKVSGATLEDVLPPDGPTFQENSSQGRLSRLCRASSGPPKFHTKARVRLSPSPMCGTLGAHLRSTGGSSVKVARGANNNRPIPAQQLAAGRAAGLKLQKCLTKARHPPWS